jgi:hypothetical protein
MPAVGVAESCHDDILRSKSNDGSILIMMSGAVYQPMLSVYTFLWLPSQTVLVCELPVTLNGKPYTAYELINLDQSDSGRVSATRLR